MYVQVMVSPVHLRLLVELYAVMNDMPSFSSDTIDTVRYVTDLRAHLRNDNFVGKNSIDIVSRLIGYPSMGQDKMGLEIDLLENIARKVMSESKYDFVGIYDIKETNYYWDTFLKVVELPSDLREFPKVYFKNLDIFQKRKIELYVDRKVSEFKNEAEKLVYKLNYYSERERKLTYAIVTIDQKEQVAILKLFNYLNNNLETRSVQRTDLPSGYFGVHLNNLFLNFTEESSTRPYFRTNFILSITESSYGGLDFIKGVYLTTGYNGTKPVCGTVMFEKMNSYKEAFNSIKSRNDYKNSILFELLSNRRILVEPNKLIKEKDFSTARIFKLMKYISGPFIFGFFEKPFAGKPITQVVFGVCYIEENGLFKMRISTGEVVEGYLNNETYLREDLFQMGTYYSDGLHSYKYVFYLKITKNEDKSIEMPGIITGHHAGKPKSSSVFFIKLDKYTSIDEMDEIDTSPVEINEANDDPYKSRIIQNLINDQEDPYLLYYDKPRNN